MSKTRTGCVCGVCFHSTGGHFDPCECRNCGADFTRGAPCALVAIDVDGLRMTPIVEFTGRWNLERRRQVEAALEQGEREPERPRLRAIAGGKRGA